MITRRTITAIVERPLTAPAHPGRAFLIGNGAIGFECPCGFTLSARSLGALQGALVEHEANPSCVFGAAKRRAADEEDVSDL